MVTLLILGEPDARISYRSSSVRGTEATLTRWRCRGWHNIWGGVHSQRCSSPSQATPPRPRPNIKPSKACSRGMARTCGPCCGANSAGTHAELLRCHPAPLRPYELSSVQSWHSRGRRISDASNGQAHLATKRSYSALALVPSFRMSKPQKYIVLNLKVWRPGVPFLDVPFFRPDSSRLAPPPFAPNNASMEREIWVSPDRAEGTCPTVPVPPGAQATQIPT